MAWAAGGGEDPRESKFLEGLLLAEVLLVLPDCHFFQPALPRLCSEEFEREYFIWYQKVGLCGERRKTFASSCLDILVWVLKAGPHTSRLLVKMYFQVTFKQCLDVLYSLECLPCLCTGSCCSWFIVSFPAASQFHVIGEGMETGIVPFVVIKASLPSAWRKT